MFKTSNIYIIQKMSTSEKTSGRGEEVEIHDVLDQIQLFRKLGEEAIPNYDQLAARRLGDGSPISLEEVRATVKKVKDLADEMDKREAKRKSLLAEGKVPALSTVEDLQLALEVEQKAIENIEIGRKFRQRFVDDFLQKVKNNVSAEDRALYDIVLETYKSTSSFDRQDALAARCRSAEEAQSRAAEQLAEMEEKATSSENVADGLKAMLVRANDDAEQFRESAKAAADKQAEKLRRAKKAHRDLQASFDKEHLARTAAEKEASEAHAAEENQALSLQMEQEGFEATVSLRVDA